MVRFFLISAMVLMLASSALAGPHIEEGDLFIGTSVDKVAELEAVPVGQSIKAKVEDVEILQKFGFKDVKLGREILLLNDGGGKWRIKMVATGEEIAVTLK